MKPNVQSLSKEEFFRRICERHEVDGSSWLTYYVLLDILEDVYEDYVAHDGVKPTDHQCGAIREEDGDRCQETATIHLCRGHFDPINRRVRGPDY